MLIYVNTRANQEIDFIQAVTPPRPIPRPPSSFFSISTVPITGAWLRGTGKLTTWKITRRASETRRESTAHCNWGSTRDDLDSTKLKWRFPKMGVPLNVPFKILKTIQKLGTPKWLIDTDCKDCWEPHPHIFPSFLSWKSCNCPALQCASLFWEFQLWAIKSRDGQWSMMDINHIWILKPPRKSPATWHFPKTCCYLNLSDTSCLKSVASLQLRLPQESTWPVTGTKNDMGNWLNLGDHICSNCHEENEVQSIGKGGVPYFQTKPCCELPIWIFGRAILVSHPEKQSKAVALICMDASASPNTSNINQPTPLLTLPILSLVWCITV